MNFPWQTYGPRSSQHHLTSDCVRRQKTEKVEIHFTTVASVSGRSTPVSEAKGGHDKHWCSANCSLSVKLIIFLAVASAHFTLWACLLSLLMCIHILFSFISDWNITAAQVSATRDRGECVRARDPQREFKSERFTECKFLSSTLMFCGLTAREEKASQSFSYKAPLSFRPSSSLSSQPHWSHSLCLLVCGETDFVG